MDKSIRAALCSGLCCCSCAHALPAAEAAAVCKELLAPIQIYAVSVHDPRCVDSVEVRWLIRVMARALI